MAQYRSQPLSRSELRRYAFQIRKSTLKERDFYFPVTEFLESMDDIFSECGYYTEIVEDHELPSSVHAAYIPDINCIRIKNSVYEGACNGVGRDRMTIMHEISHFLLIQHCGVQFQRAANREVKPYEDPEWQATCLAAELLVPAHLIKGMGAQEVSKLCGVSLQAATYQISKIK